MLLAAAGCSRKSPPTPPVELETATATAAETSQVHLPPGIDWFPGDVDAAFAAAKSAEKPIFLYWGAEWCPPCAQIKSTIFNTREFQERSRLFVPVYLDGDTPSAQRHGERFGVMGYPTMILFRADGTEITRLPGGVDVARYATILDAALADGRPVAEILQAALGNGAVTPSDWRLLAYYSWGTDHGRILPPEQHTTTFRRLYEACPKDMQPECARFYFEYLGAAADEAGESKSPLDGATRKAELGPLMRLLGSAEVAGANVDSLLYGATDVVGLLSEPGSPEREQLLAEWRAALDTLGRGGAGVALSGPEQLNLVRARILLKRLEAPDAPLS
jgi:thioredoxin-related protein